MSLDFHVQITRIDESADCAEVEFTHDQTTVLVGMPLSALRNNTDKTLAMYCPAEMILQDIPVAYEEVDLSTPVLTLIQEGAVGKINFLQRQALLAPEREAAVEQNTIPVTEI